MKAHPHGHAAMHRDVECPALPTAGPRRRPHWLSAKRVRTYAIAALVCYAAFGGIYLARWLSGGLGSPLPPALDFVPAWSAAHLAVHGHALDAWRFAALHPVELQAAPSMRGMRGVLLWLYPPQTLLLVAPLGWLPYPVAALAWVVGTGALFVATVRAIVPRRLRRSARSRSPARSSSRSSARTACSRPRSPVSASSRCVAARRSPDAASGSSSSSRSSRRCFRLRCCARRSGAR